MIERYKSKATSNTLEGSLKERLDVLDGEAAELQKRTSEVNEQRELIRKLLELEMRRTGRTDPKRRRDLGEIVRDSLLAGKARKDTMQEAALANGHPSPARGINAIVMSYKNHGYVVQEDDEFELTAKGKAAFTQSGKGGS